MGPIAANNQTKIIQETPASVVETETENFFDTEHLKTDLKGRSVRGGAVTMTAQAIKFLLHTGSTVVLARLLTPQDYGLIAMVTAITGFVVLFKDMGLSMATVQKAEINHSQVSTLFWINVAVSFLLALILALTAPIISWFYGEPRLTLVALALSGTFILSGLTVQHQALLRRQMRFFALAIIEIVSMAIGIVTAIILAWYGIRYWALVGMSAATALSNAVLVWVFCGWRPGLPVLHSGVRPMLAFGGNLTGFNFLNYFARNLDNILIGWYWGAGPLGLYSKAYGLLMLPLHQINSPIAAVAIPALSRLQNHPEQYRKFYLKAIKLIAYITMPMIATMAVLSRELVTLLLGKQWIRASPIFMVLAFAAFFQSISNANGWVYISLNRTKRMAIWGLIASPLICVSFAVGLPWGPMGVAISYAALGYLLFYFGYAFCFKSTPVTLRDVFSTLFRPVVFSLSIFAAMVVTRIYLYHTNPISIVLGCMSIGSIIAILVILVCTSIRADMSDIIETINTAFRQRKT